MTLLLTAERHAHCIPMYSVRMRSGLVPQDQLEVYLWEWKHCPNECPHAVGAPTIPMLQLQQRSQLQLQSIRQYNLGYVSTYDPYMRLQFAPDYILYDRLLLVTTICRRWMRCDNSRSNIVSTRRLYRAFANLVSIQRRAMLRSRIGQLVAIRRWIFQLCWAGSWSQHLSVLDDATAQFKSKLHCV
jgi:hypothetical protein